MAIKKKAAKPAKKVQSKKTVKPVSKKPAPAKKGISSKSAKKEVSKKTTPVAKKHVPMPAKKGSDSKHTAKKPVVQASGSKSKAPVKAPVVASKLIPQKAQPSKPVVHHEAKKPEPRVEAKHIAPVIPLPEVKKPVAPAKPVKVVIPEMKTKTVRKYEPEFTKSVLDTFQQEQTGPTMRYSDVELNEFRELITKKLEAAKKELAYLQGLITRRDEMGGDETDNRYMTMEDGSMSMEREQLSQMASRQITFIDHLEKAIMRIENKTYGICRVTGKLIDKARLKAVPHATLSIEAKQTMNK
jgi:RNA polymerase-binding transcription factor DksA